ncbi:hypothetical protein LRH25_19415 [Ideonella azotifigens]|uniref:Glycine zipper domain-containing protein n=1 Tax=Ideonella azotifigens TaxID=513160 RepID=A0ABN1K668_9BURK|nr:hypothetical protein [Ideonella azotifigens]MCD2342499.1 hypothetical protein [Ideonella azotifigens]
MTTSNPLADANRDPITGAPGAHPIGTGVGAAVGGMAAGAAMGTVAGPVGTAIGAAAGAIIGGLAGKGVAEQVDPTREDAYWRENYRDRPYVDSALAYDEYAPAYSLGHQYYSQYPDASFDDIEPQLGRDWDERYRGNSSLSWDKAKHATRDAWERVSNGVERAIPGDSDHDGR